MIFWQHVGHVPQGARASHLTGGGKLCSIVHARINKASFPRVGERLLYCDHIDRYGEGLFRLACEHDVEGIVAKRKSDPYLSEHATWLKIRNQEYSQWVGREELFERERGSDPDFQVRQGCVLACEEAIIA